MIYVFGDCELDLGRYELRRAGAVQPVEPQVFDVLALLLRERGRCPRRSCWMGFGGAGSSGIRR